MKPANNARNALLATLLAGTSVLSTGCSTGGFPLASMNPFSRSVVPTSSEPAASGPGITESIASTTSGATNQIRTMGSTAKNAMTKTRDAVTGIFSSSESAEDMAANDPLSLANRPKNIGPEVFVANGQLWESTGDFNKAMESYAKALESESNNGPALTSIARLHFRKGNHKQAAEFFQKAIQQNPEDAGLHNDLGLTLSKLGNHAAASTALQKSLELAPGTSRYANNLASVRFQAGDSESAYQVLSQNNKPAVAHFNMAYLHFKNGQLLEAKRHLGQAMQSQPQAAGDAAVQRAVERSRDLLAQIDSTIAPIAQAAPQATIAGGQFFQQDAGVKQTSQSATTSVPPQAAKGPSLSGIGLPTTAPAATAPATTAPVTQTPTATATPKPTRPMPIKPTASGPAPSVPFAMPGSFSE